MKYTEKQIKKVLKNVNSPATGKDVVSSGILQDIRINGNNIELTLVFQKSNDPHIEIIAKACRGIIKKEVGEEAEVTTTVKAHDIVETNSAPGNIKNIICVASGKGGVGKSTVAANLAVALANKNYKTGLVDADIFGPSIPKMFNIEQDKAYAVKKNGKDVIVPVEKYNVKVLSIGFFVDPGNAVIWRGPMASNALKQLINDTDWGGLDYLVVDLPPGTSDIHITLVQTVPVTGAIIVSTPQQVALADAVKGINMFRTDKIDVPVLGLVENMAWFTPEELPDKKYYIFGKEGCKNLANKMNTELLGQIPIVQSIMEDGDDGTPSALDENTKKGKAFTQLADRVVEAVEKRNKEQAPTQKTDITNH